MIVGSRIAADVKNPRHLHLGALKGPVSYPERLNLFSFSIGGISNRRYKVGPSAHNFLNLLSGKRVLFIGEGNFSFVASLVKPISYCKADIIATSFESSKEWLPATIENIASLRENNIVVQDSVDGTKLDKYFHHGSFDVIVFQFPNTGNRDGIRGRTSNFVLVRRFLRSARICLKECGCILITVVDSPYHKGVFHFPQAARDAGFDVTGPMLFDPADFPGYQHINTNDDESAIEDYDRFGTWVFTPVE